MKPLTATRKMSSHPLENNPWGTMVADGVREVESWLGTVFRQGSEVKGFSSAEKTLFGLPGSAVLLSDMRAEISNPATLLMRKGLTEIEAPMVSRTLQEGKNLVRQSVSHLGGIEALLAADIGRSVKAGVCHSEPIIYRALNRAARCWATFSWREVLRNTESLIQQLFGKPPPELVQKGLPRAYKIRRILLATAIGYACVHLMLKIHQRIAPYIAKKLGSRLDRVAGVIPYGPTAIPRCPKPVWQTPMYGK
jgi:hypothetical protein